MAADDVDGDPDDDIVGDVPPRAPGIVRFLHRRSVWAIIADLVVLVVFVVVCWWQFK